MRNNITKNKKIYLTICCLLFGIYVNAQCPAGQTEITLEIFHTSFGNEVGWELVNQTTGTVIACQPAGTYATSATPTLEGPFCVTDGNTLVFTGYDSFGDDWNGGFFNVIVTEDGSVNGCAAQDGCVVLQNAGEGLDVEPDVSVTNSCETSNEEFVITLPIFGCDATAITGCTTMGDLNFDPCATIDDGSCICSDTQAGIADGSTFCAADAAATATAILPLDAGVTAIQTVDGGFDGEHGLGLYQGTFDDGSVIGLPPAGTGLFGTDTETSIEGSTPGANNITTVGNWGATSAVGNSFTSAPLMDGATYTLYIVDDFGDGWDGSDADLLDCEGNVIIANLAQFIDAIAADAQDELAWTTFTYTAPPATVAWSGTGAVTTDPDGTPNSGDEVYTFDPSMAGATGCASVDVDLTMSVTSCGVTCAQMVTVTVYPSAFTANVVDDGSGCGTPTVELVAADGTVCETETGAACVADGDMFTTNFAATATVAALAGAPAGCVMLPAEETITCAGCIVIDCNDPCFAEYDPTATGNLGCLTATPTTPGTSGADQTFCATDPTNISVDLMATCADCPDVQTLVDCIPCGAIDPATGLLDPASDLTVVTADAGCTVTFSTATGATGSFNDNDTFQPPGPGLPSAGGTPFGSIDVPLDGTLPPCTTYEITVTSIDWTVTPQGGTWATEMGFAVTGPDGSTIVEYNSCGAFGTACPGQIPGATAVADVPVSGTFAGPVVFPGITGPGGVAVFSLFGETDFGPGNVDLTINYSVEYTAIPAVSGQTTGPVVAGPPADIVWYSDMTSTTPIGTGSPLDPAGLVDENGNTYDEATPGTYTFYHVCECNGCESDRVPAMITVAPACDAACTTTQTVECDGNPCTVGDVQVLGSDGSECSCTGGTLEDCATGTTTTVGMECDGDPTTIDMLTTLDCDGSQCDCVGTPSFSTFTIVDPCICNNDESAPGAGDGTFGEVVEIVGLTGFMLRTDATTGTPPGPNVMFDENPPGSGIYQLTFDHDNGVGYTINDVEASNDGGTTWNSLGLSISNVCEYPTASIDPLPVGLVCDSPVENLTAIITDGMAGVGACPTAFTDIAGTGVAFDLGDDGEIGITTTNSYTFYGVSYTDFTIGNNGDFYLGTLTANSDFSNETIDGSGSSQTLPGIYPFWDDLMNGGTGSVIWQEIGTQLIVQWNDLRDCCGASNPGDGVTFQLIWDSATGAITFVYDDVINTADGSHDNGGSASIGLDNADGANFTEFSFDDVTFLSGGGCSITYTPDGAGGYTQSTENSAMSTAATLVWSGSGVTDAGDNLNGTFDPALSGPGTHTITLTYMGADDGNGGISPDGGTTPAFPGCEVIATYEVTVGACVEIADPCACLNELSPNGLSNQFSETVTVFSGSFNAWQIAPGGNTGLFDPADGVTLIPDGTFLPQGPAGTFTLPGVHDAAAGYSLTLCSLCDGTDDLTIGNTCFYPIVTTPAPIQVCADGLPVDLDALFSADDGQGNVATGVYTYTNNADGSAITSPFTDVPGTYTIDVNFDQDDAATVPCENCSPGCVVTEQIIVEILPPATVDLTAIEFCDDSDLDITNIDLTTFEAAINAGATIDWFFGDPLTGGIPIFPDIAVDLNVVGADLWVLVDDGVCPVSAQITVDVVTGTGVPAVTGLAICPGDPNGDLAATGLTAECAGGATTTATAAFPDAGIYDVAFGLSSGVLGSVMVNPDPASTSLVQSGADIEVCFTIDHSWASDMEVILTSPGGLEAIVLADEGGSNDLGDGDELTAPATIQYCFSPAYAGNDLGAAGNPIPGGNYEPTDVLPFGLIDGSSPILWDATTFIGEPVNGMWSLRFMDDAGGDDGIVSSASISITAPAGVSTTAIVTWYDAATGGTAQGTGSPFDPTGTTAEEGAFDANTPGTYTYYASCTDPCEGGRTPITVVVEASPDAIDPALVFCGTDDLTSFDLTTLDATVSPAGLPVFWVDGAGVPINSPNGADLPLIGLTNIFAVVDDAATGCSATVNLTITIEPDSDPPTAAGLNICPGDPNGDLSATGLTASCAAPITTMTIAAFPDAGIYDVVFGLSSGVLGSVMVNPDPASAAIVQSGDDIEVCFTIDHSFSGDMEVILTSPNGLEAIVLADEGSLNDLGDGDESTAPATIQYCFSPAYAGNDLGAAANPIPGGNYEPTDVLPFGLIDGSSPILWDATTFIGEPVNGMWSLRFMDDAGGDDGIVSSASITITATAPGGTSPTAIITWYDDPTAGTAQGTGSPFDPTGTTAEEGAFDANTPGTYTYYVSCADPCESTRTAVSVVVEEPPVITDPEIAFCGGLTDMSYNLAANDAVVGGGNAVAWYIGDPNAGGTLINPATTADLTDPAIVANGLFAEVTDAATGCVATALIPVSTTPDSDPPTVAGLTVCEGDANGDIAAIGLTASCVSAGGGVPVSLDGDLTGATDVFARPFGCGPASGAADHPYEAISFTVDVSGTYDILSNQNDGLANQWDGYAFIYDGAFDPLNPDVGCLGSDDDGAGGVGTSDIVGVSLTAGVTYTLVTTTFSSGGTGDTYTTALVGPGSAVTPPSLTWWDAATGGTLIGAGSPLDPTGLTGEEGTVVDANTAGTYTFYAQCDDNGCPSARVPVVLVIEAVPVAVDPALMFCTPDDLTSYDLTQHDATVNGGSGLPVTWLDGNGNVINPATVADLPAIGLTSITAQVDDASTGCASSVNITITINPLPTVVAEADMPCVGEVLTISETGSTGGVAWSWTTDGGSAIADPAAQTTTTAGAVDGDVFTVMVTTAAGCTAEASVTAAFNPLPEANDPMIMACDTDDLTSYDLTAFDAVVDGGAGNTVVWFDANGNVINPATAADLDVLLALGPISASVTDANGCTASTAITVTTNMTAVSPTVAGLTVCAGDPNGDIAATGLTADCGGGGETVGAFAFDASAFPVVVEGAGDTGSATVAVTFPTGATVSNLSVDVDMWHSWMSDVNISITSPAGTVVAIMDGVTNAGSDDLGPGSPADGTGASGSGSYTFTDAGASILGVGGTGSNDLEGTYQPASPFSAFAGEDPNGIWTITFSDDTGGDDGEFTAASMTITATQPSTIASTWWDAASGGTQQGAGSPFDPTGTTAEEGAFDATVPGIYTYYAECDMGNGCIGARVPVTVEILDAPTADAGGPYAKCPADALLLDGTAADGTAPYTFAWTATGGSFDDVTLEDPTYNMMVPGIYTLTLTVTDANGCTATSETEVTVDEAPNAEIASNTVICAGGVVSLAEIGGSAVATWDWTTNGTATFDDNTIANPIASNVSDGEIITVVVTNVAGCTATASVVIAVGEIDAGEDATICAGESTTLDATVVSAGAVGVFQGYTVDDACTTGFIDISGSGTALGLGDDGEAYITTTNTYTLFTTAYTNFGIGNNGGIIVGATGSEQLFTGNTALTGGGASGNPVVSPLWDDWDSDIGDVYWQEMGTMLIVQWDDRPHFSGTGAVAGDGVTFQVIWDSATGTITFVYDDLDNALDATESFGATATIGLDAADGVNFVESSFDDATLLSSTTCISYVPDFVETCAFAGWSDDGGATIFDTNLNTVVNPLITTTYTAVLTCGGVSCTDEVTITVEDEVATNDPMIEFCADEDLTSYDLTQHNAEAYPADPSLVVWYDGDPSIGGNVINPATAADLAVIGTGNVWAQVSASSGCSGAMNITITVLPAPFAAVTADMPCIGDVVSLSETGSTAGVAWSWTTDGTGAIADAGAQATTASGANDGDTFTVMVTDASGCTATAATTVTFMGGPLLVDPVLAFCASDDLTSYDLTQHDGDVDIFDAGTTVWYAGDPANGGTPINPPTTVDLTDPIITGNGVWALTTGANGCSSAIMVTIDIAPNPAAPTVASIEACIGDDIADFEALGASCPDELAFISMAAASNGSSLALFGGTVAFDMQTAPLAPSGCTLESVTATFTLAGSDVVLVNTTTNTSVSGVGPGLVTLAPLAVSPGDIIVPVSFNGGPVAADFEAELVYTYTCTIEPMITWWDTPTGGTNLGMGTTFDAEAIVGNGLPGTYTFYAQTGCSGCPSDRAEAVLTINESPIATDANIMACVDEDLASYDLTQHNGDVSATGIVTWYDGNPGAGGVLINPATAADIGVIGAGNVWAQVTDPATGCTSAVLTTISTFAVPTASIEVLGSVCERGDLVLNENGGDAVSWSWATDGTAVFNDATLQNPIALGATGSETISVTITDANGCTATDAITVAFDESPEANDPMLVFCAGDDLTSYDLTQWETVVNTVGASVTWYAGDPFAGGTIINPAQVADLPFIGLNNVWALVNDPTSNCANSVNITITINALPTAVASASTVCEGSNVQLTEAGTGGIAWSWTTDGSAVITNPTDQNPVASGAADGDTFTVTITDDNGCSATSAVAVTLLPLPVATPITIEVCEDEACVDLTQYAGDFAPYGVQWYLGDPNAGGQLIFPLTCVSITKLQAGDVWVVVIDENGCSLAVMISVVVNPSPVAIAGASGDCPGEEVQLTESGTGGIAWAWTTDGGATITSPTDENPVATGAVDGETFTVVVTNDNGCTATDEITITLSDPVVINDPVIEVCVSDTMCLDLMSYNSQISTTGTVGWYDGDPLNGGTNIFPTSCVRLNKIDELWVLVTDDKGCTVAVEIIIIINDNPAPIATATGMCPDAEIQLSDTGTGGLVWSWTTDGGAVIADPTAQSTSASGAADGETFTVVATNESGCTATSSVTVMINNPIVLVSPVLEFCPGDTSCVNLGALGGLVSTAGDVDWYNNDPTTGGIMIFPVSCVSLNKIEDLWATVTDENGCTYAVDVIVNITPVQITVCPGDIVATAGADCSADVTVPPVEFDACEGAVATNSYNGTTDASDNYPLGVTTVVWTVSDSNGNAVTCDHTVTVTAPVGMMDTTIVLTIDTICMISDQDLFVDDATFGANGNYPFTDPGTDPAATISDITLELYFRVAGASCESDIEAQVFDPTGALVASFPASSIFSTCNGMGPGIGTLYNVTLPITSATVTGAMDDWIVEFNDSNGQNAGDEYSARFGRICYVATIADTTIITTASLAITTCPADATAMAPIGACAANVNVAPIAFTSCIPASATNDYNGTSNASGSYPVGTTVVTWTVTDLAGNTATCETTVTVTGNDNPLFILCQGAASAIADPASCDANVTISQAVATDCGTVTVTNDYTGTDNASGTYPIGTTTVTWTATDNDGNTATCQTVVTVTEGGPTIVSCPADMTQGVDQGSCDAAVTVPALVAEDCGAVTITNSFNAGGADASGTYPIGTTTVVWTVTDDDGNMATCSADITVTDVGPTIVSCPANIVQGVDVGTCSAAVTIPAPGTLGGLDATDCGSITITNDKTGTADASDTYPVGTTTVIWTVTDDDGNTATCSTDVTVLDDGPTIVSCPADITQGVDQGSCDAAITVPAPGALGGLDAEDCGTITITNDFNGGADASGSYPVGTTTVVWTVTDNDGNTATCSTDITVVDDGPTIVLCSGTISAVADPATCNATVSVPAVSADDCGTVTIINDYNNSANASDTYPIGTTTVVWTVTDNDGNTATCATNVVVTDAGPTIVSCPANMTQGVDQGSCEATVSVPALSATDCGATTVTNDFNGSADASGSYPIGTTTVTWTVTDSDGNTATCSTDITVIDVGPTIVSCPADITAPVIPNQCVANVNVPALVADDCGTVTVTNDKTGTANASGSYPVGTTTVVWTVTDNDGNAVTCSTDVTVQDDGPVLIFCQGAVSSETDSGSCEATISMPTPIADDCGTITITNDYTGTDDASGVYPLGATSVVWTVTDNDGNMTTCETTVTVFEGMSTVVVMDTVSVVSDQDAFIDDIGFAANPSTAYADPGTSASAVLSDIELLLYFRLEGSSCEGDIDVQVTDPAGNTSTYPAIFGAGACIGGNALYTTTITIPAGMTTGVPGNWTVAFDDSNGQNAGAEYSIRAGVLTYIATTTTVVGGAPTITSCPTDVTTAAAAGTCAATVSIDPLEANDCGAFTIINDYNGTDDASDSYPVGTTLVTWTVTDNDGNAVTCETTVTVTDEAGPTIVACPDNIVITAPDNGLCEADINVPLLQAADCGTTTITNDYTGTDDATSTYPVGSTIVTWTVADNDGNEVTCQQVVTVLGPITSAVVEIVSDQDDFVDNVGFANNPTMTYTDPGTVAGASLTNIELTLFFKTEGISCESDIAINVYDPAGNLVDTYGPGTTNGPLFTTCFADPDMLHTVTVPIQGGSTTGNINFWTIEFDDVAGQNAGDEYSFRAGVLRYTASFNTCGGPVFITDNSGDTDNIDSNDFETKVEETLVNDIHVYPVPAMSNLTLEYKSEVNNENLLIEIFTNDGRVILSSKEVAQEGLNNYNLNVTSLTAGTYFIRAIPANGVPKVKPFIKVSP